jgi:hypothetical protein
VMNMRAHPGARGKKLFGRDWLHPLSLPGYVAGASMPAHRFIVLSSAAPHAFR